MPTKSSRTSLWHEWLLEGAGAFGFIALIICVFLGSSVHLVLLRSQSTAAVIAAAIVELVNQDRGSDNLKGLTVNPMLVAAAEAKAKDMATRGYFAHVSPDGKDSWYWFKAAGYTFRYAGENLAVDFSDSVDVERAWMNSPTHRANIMDGNFTEIGVGTAVGIYNGRQTVFVVQMFGSPAKNRDAQAPIQAVTTTKDPKKPAIAKTVLGATAEKTTRAEAPLSPAKSESGGAGAIVISSPHTLSRSLYYLIGALIALTLAIATGFEIQRHHTTKALVAAGLLVLLCGFYILSERVLFTEPILSSIRFG